MRRLFTSVLLIVLLGIGIPVAAQTGSDEPRWSASVSFSLDPSVSGALVSTASGAVGNQPLVLNAIGYGDVYGLPTRWRLGAGYMLDERSEATAAISFTSEDGSRQVVSVAPGASLVGDFSAYTERVFEVGYRYHFDTIGNVRPFAGGTLGVARVGDINALVGVPGVSVLSTTLAVYDESTSATFSLGGGVVYPLTSRFGIVGDLALRWRGGLNGADPLVGTGLERLDKDSSRWSIPISIGGVLRLGSE